MRRARPARSRPTRYVRPLLACAVAVLVAVLPVAPAHATGYPGLPVRLDRAFLGNLTGPTLTPGASGQVTFSVGNPLAGTIDSVVLSLDLYAFNAFPGNASSTVPVAGAPVLSVAGLSGSSVNLSLGSLAAGTTTQGSVAVATSSSTPDGTFALRTAVSFVLASNDTTYRLESRGWFSATLWQAATELPNGSVTLNLTTLGVSGVTPETSVYVEGSTWDWVLTGLLAGAAVLLGAAAYVYFRRGPGSTSGTR